jgi:hypothetical protein
MIRLTVLVCLGVVGPDHPLVHRLPGDIDLVVLRHPAQRLRGADVAARDLVEDVGVEHDLADACGFLDGRAP